MKTISPAQIEANRNNALRSTGPKTPAGKAASSKNGFKHALRFHEVVIQGTCLREDKSEFSALHQRLWDDLKPSGILEEMLAGQIVATHWRLRRALKAESGEIALSVDGNHLSRAKDDALKRSWFMRDPITNKFRDPARKMKESSLGNFYLDAGLGVLRDTVEDTGTLTEAALKNLRDMFGRLPNELSEEMEKLRDDMQKNVLGLQPDELKAKALACIDRKIKTVTSDKARCEQQEKIEEQSHQAANALPPPHIVDKLMRYIKSLERHLFQSMDQLERLQRRRQGETVPPPVAVQVSSSE